MAVGADGAIIAGVDEVSVFTFEGSHVWDISGVTDLGCGFSGRPSLAAWACIGPAFMFRPPFSDHAGLFASLVTGIAFAESACAVWATGILVDIGDFAFVAVDIDFCHYIYLQVALYS